MAEIVEGRVAYLKVDSYNAKVRQGLYGATKSSSGKFEDPRQKFQLKGIVLKFQKTS